MAEEKNTIGRYEIIEMIGEGGYGIVYKANDPGLGILVAIKVLKPQLTFDPTALERFRLEARQASKLKHPHIVTIFELGESQGRYYIAMEYIDGQPLSTIIEDEGPLSPRRTLAIIQQVGEALDHAHSRRMIHRDVKPSNIMVGPEDWATLTDFGIVKAMDEAGVTSTETSVGTCLYMSPEQITSEKIDPRADLYSLGVVAYHMLTGQTPFTGTKPFAIQKGHAEKPPPIPHEINPSLGEYLSQVLLKSLAKAPNQRYQSGAEMTEAFSKAVQRQEGSYWDEVYAQAKLLMEQRKFREALEKWEYLLHNAASFDDLPAQIKLAKQQMDLDERYAIITEQVNQALQGAMSIKSEDHAYPDKENTFKRLGLLNDRVIPVPTIPTATPDSPETPARKFTWHPWVEFVLVIAAASLTIYLAKELWKEAHWFETGKALVISPLARTGLPLMTVVCTPILLSYFRLLNLFNHKKWLGYFCLVLGSLGFIWGAANFGFGDQRWLVLLPSMLYMLFLVAQELRVYPWITDRKRRG